MNSPERSFADDESVPAESPASGERSIEVGRAIYVKQCAGCHGDQGQGVEDRYPDPLVGDSSIDQLAEIIDETMPEEDPEACRGNDAKSVAEYVHRAFYSANSNDESADVKQHFARLTANQLRQSLSDLYGCFGFGGEPQWSDERGLRARYYTSGSTKKENLKIERVDPTLDFDWGNDGPGEGINAKDFRVFWNGSLAPDHSGRYEIIVRSTCSMQMEFGARDRMLIDNHVQSEGKDEFRRIVTLQAGRHYSIDIEFQQRKRKTKLPPARFSLSWVPPGGVEQLIPARNLWTKSQPGTYSLNSKLPPDDESYGYKRGTDINRAWDDSTTQAALEFGQIVATELWPEYRRRHRRDKNENRQQLREFLSRLVSTAFRRKLDEETKQLYIERQLAAAPDDADAIRRVCLLTVKSPRFLYPTVDQDLSPSRRAANRLALTLFDSLPSGAWLIRLADDNKLENDGPLRSAATRMLSDPRARGKIHEMLYAFFEIDPASEITKDQDLFPGFDGRLVADLRGSADAMLSDIVWSEESDFRQLYLADWVYSSRRLQEFYGDAWQVDSPNADDADPLLRTERRPGKHFGMLSHPLLMSDLAYHKTSSPIHRGVFLTRHSLGRILRPPNEAFTPINPELHPDLTTRQRISLQTDEAKCQVCHQKINSLGFTLENFDAVGRFRTTEKKQPIDASGSYVTLGGKTIPLDGISDLATFLAESPDSHRAFVEHVFEHLTHQPLAAFGPTTRGELLESFRQSDYNIQKLIIEIAVLVARNPDGRTSQGPPKTEDAEST